MEQIGSEKGLVGAGRAATAVARSASPGAEPEQLDLGLPAITQPDGSKTVPKRHGPGRPSGSTNVLTRRWRDFLLSRYPSPLEGIVAISALSVEDIAKSVHCSLLEAMNIKIRCLEKAADFLYPKLQATLYHHRAGDPRGGDASLLVLSEETGRLDLTPDYPPDSADSGE